MRRTVAIELGALFSIAGAFMIELHHMAHSLWIDVFLRESDSLTLPLLYRSIRMHQPLEWVISSQLNLFPEALLFIPSAIFTHSVQGSLLVNALLNVLTFYGLLRLFLKLATPLTLRQRQLYGVMTMLMLFGMMLLEVPTAFGQTMFTYLLFNTYYDGPLFIGILNMCYIIYCLQQKPLPWLTTRKNRLLLTGLIITNTLTIASNPLYVLVFVIPLLIVQIAIYKPLKLTRKGLQQLTAVQIVGLLPAFILRATLLRHMFAESPAKHIGKVALLDLHPLLGLAVKIMAPVAETNGIRLRIIISTLLYFICLIVFLLALNHYQKKDLLKIKPPILFTISFIALQPIIIMVLLYPTSPAPRYLLAPLLTSLLLVPCAASMPKLRQYDRHIALLTALLSLLAIVGGSASLRDIHRYYHRTDHDQACLNSALDGRPANGLAYYLVSRQLDAYNTHGQRVLQMRYELPPTIHPWLSNVGDYHGRMYSFYVQERNPAFTPIIDLNVKPATPAGYTSVTSCNDFYIYHYAPGSKGYNDLNHSMQRSLDAYEAEKAIS